MNKFYLLNIFFFIFLFDCFAMQDQNELLTSIFEDKPCLICRENLDKNIVELSCHKEHCFHISCVKEWFDSQISINLPPNCPTCRALVRYERPNLIDENFNPLSLKTIFNNFAIGVLLGVSFSKSPNPWHNYFFVTCLIPFIRFIRDHYGTEDENLVLNDMFIAFIKYFGMISGFAFDKIAFFKQPDNI